LLVVLDVGSLAPGRVGCRPRRWSTSVGAGTDPCPRPPPSHRQPYVLGDRVDRCAAGRSDGADQIWSHGPDL